MFDKICTLVEYQLAFIKMLLWLGKAKAFLFRNLVKKSIIPTQVKLCLDIYFLLVYCLFL